MMISREFRRSRSSTVPIALTALLALSLSACGSTALRGVAATGQGTNGLNGTSGTDAALQATTDGSTGGDTSSGSSGTGITTPGGTGSSGLGTPGGSTGGSTGGATGSATGSAGAGTTGGTSGGPQAVSKKPVKVGLYVLNLAALAAAFGMKSSDASAMPKAMMTYINKHGGIGGRQISVITYTGDVSNDYSTGAQAACAAFTQDNKVDVVIDFGYGSSTLAACLKQKNVPDFDVASTWTTDATDHAQYPNWLVPTGMEINRQIQSLLQVSFARSSLKAGDKLGVMVEGCPYDLRTYDNIVVPFAKQHGISVVQGAVKCVTNLVRDVSPVAQAAQQAALKFASSGVTHVMAIGNTESFMDSQFMTNASQQHYHPKYLVTSNAYPSEQDQSRSDAKQWPTDQIPNVSGVGYVPGYDVSRQALTSNAAQTARQKVCQQADPQDYQAAASDNTYGQWFRLAGYYAMCDTIFALKASAEAAGLSFAAPDIARGFTLIKQRGEVSAALNGGTFGGQSTSDGVGVVQPFAWSAAQGRFTYVGAAQKTAG